MENHSQKRIFLLVIGLLLSCSIAAILEARFKVVQRSYDNFVLDNHNHYLPCSKLPTRTEVEGIIAQHQAVIQQIQQVAPGSVGIEIDTSICDGKADLLIWYGTHAQRVAIEKILAGDTFFGIPYRLQNR
jgi:hypothetical protein